MTTSFFSLALKSRHAEFNELIIRNTNGNLLFLFEFKFRVCICLADRITTIELSFEQHC